jgi:hypothetical protein
MWAYITQEGDERMKQKLLAFGSIAGAALLAVAAFALPLPPTPRFFLFLLGGLTSTTGFLLCFPTVLERTTLPRELETLVDTLVEDFADDIEDIRQPRITSTHFAVVMTMLASSPFFWFVLHYAKLGAKWGSIPVLIPTVIAVFVAVFVMGQSKWFQYRRFRTPPWVFLIPLAGLVISTGLGIHMTEPLEYRGSTAHERAQARVGGPQEYDYTATRAYYYDLGDIFYLGDGSSDLISDLDCDDEACLILLLVVVLIVVTIALIVGSAAIPHFWVLAGFTLLTVMGMIALRELRVRIPRQSRSATV